MERMAKLVLLSVVSNAVEGELLRGRLEAEGISVLAKGEADGPYRVGPLYLWVSEEDEMQAQLILAEVEAGSLAIDEDDELR
jgi:putative signal transducing protein